MLKIKLYLVVLFTVLVCGSPVFAESLSELARVDIVDNKLQEHRPKSVEIPVDFETYQRNIDDIFQIALMKSPTTLDYGINSVIVNLNRKIAKDSNDPTSLVSLGHVYRILGQPSEANRFYEKALMLDPDNFHLNVFSALTFSQMPDLGSALSRLDKAVKLNPLDVYAWVTKARLLMMAKRNDEAIESFLKVLEIEPDYRQASFALSLLYQQTGQGDKAIEVLEKLREKNPEDVFIQYHLGALSFAQGKIAKAIQHWNRLYYDGVRDTQFLFNLAMAYLENKEIDKAQKILEHLQFFLPEEKDIQLLLAESYRQMDRLAEAERRYKIVLAEHPRYITAYMGLAQVLDELGKETEREDLLRQASFYVNLEQKKALKEIQMREFRQAVFEDPDYPPVNAGFDATE